MLAECESLVNWLLDHNDTAEFNRLLEVCRPNTDEPRLLSSIASLVTIRTTLLPLFGRKEHYSGLEAFLAVFQTQVDLVGEQGYEHLRNLQSTFEGLIEVFEKQTRSPGIKSCYEIRDINQRGRFMLKATSQQSQVLYLEMKANMAAAADEKQSGADGAAAQTQEQTREQVQKQARTEPLEYLLDLRSKIMMTEVPEELEKEYQMSKLVDAFVSQLQVLIEMRDEVYELYALGHFEYQEGWSACFEFSLHGLGELQEELSALRVAKANWQSLVHSAREKYYFLNYFTMREILTLTQILLGRESSASSSSSDATTEAKLWEEKNKEEKQRAEEREAKEREEKARKAAEELPPEYSCEGCTFINPIAAPSCSICGTARPAKYKVGASGSAASSSLSSGGVGVSSEAKDIKIRFGQHKQSMDALTKVTNFLYLCSSLVDEDSVKSSMQLWKGMVQEAMQNDAQAQAKGHPAPGKLLQLLGRMLDNVFCSAAPIVRAIPPPGAEAKNRADMLIRVEENSSGSTANDDDRSIPVWVGQAQSPIHVIECVLSVFVRRGRLPEPGEIVFCTSSTTLEEIELLFRRFIKAKQNGRGECVFCVADVHALSYTLQVTVVEKLRTFLSDYGVDQAASLLLVSGKSRQVLLNSLSSQSVDIPPLDIDTLRAALARACALHCGETLCVTSAVNGGGKTHHIMKLIGDRQKEGEDLAYRRVPYRESSNASSLVARLSSVPANERSAFHLDIGHIIPANANTVLFELMIVGVLKNTQTCQVYHRKSQDAFLLEIPNSVENKTALALRFLSLLPSTNMVVSAETLDIKRPIFTDAECTRISSPGYYELEFVCKYIRAYLAGERVSVFSWFVVCPSSIHWRFGIVCVYTLIRVRICIHAYILISTSSFSYAQLNSALVIPGTLTTIPSWTRLPPRKRCSKCSLATAHQTATPPTWPSSTSCSS